MSARHLPPSSEPRSYSHIRIAHALHSLELGGAQQVVKYLISHGDRAAFDHRIYAGKTGEMHAEVAAIGAHIEILPRHIPKLDPLWILRLRRALVRDRIDVLHTHLFGDSLHGVAAAASLGAPPVVVTLHNSIRDFTGIQRRGYRWLLPRAAAAVACAPAAGASFREFLSGTGASIEVIANGVDPDSMDSSSAEDIHALRHDLGLPPGALVIGAMGRLVEQKGFDLLIDAFGRLVANGALDARLVIVGDGPLRAELEGRGIRAGIGDRIVWTGFRADARRLLPLFDILAFGSRYEGLPMTLLEGMASRRCIVATPVPGLAEILTDGVDGLVAENRDLQSFGATLARAQADVTLRRRLGDGAYETFHARYTVGRMVEHYENLYRRVLETRIPDAKETDRRS
jgi:glycosyltransferase involved in cell wall biosynthesis